MKVLLINTSERYGGAAVAASRLQEALKNNGVKATMLVRDKQTNRTDVVALPHGWRTAWNFVWERVVIWAANRFERDRIFAVDIANTGTDVTALPEFSEADIIHLHWVNQGMLSLRDLGRILASGKPVVWTMHDMWPATGICHYPGKCYQYQTNAGCHKCPILSQRSFYDLAQKVFKKKLRLYAGHHITFVGCSRWIADMARKSRLLQGQTVVSIPNPINTSLFRPHDKQAARARCGLPQEGRLLLFGSVKITDKRKGIDYLVEACRLLARQKPELRQTMGVVLFGNDSNVEQVSTLLPFRTYGLGYIRDEHRLVDIYNAVDLYVTPSLEDNLPNMIMEAMACGTPCVGFNTGGIPEMIDHLHNGYVARYQSAEDLANGICWTLNEGDYQSLSEQAVRKVAARYAEPVVARQFIELYNRLA